MGCNSSFFLMITVEHICEIAVFASPERELNFLKKKESSHFSK